MISYFLQVSWCKIGKHSLFIVASTFGVQIFDDEQSGIVFSHGFLDSTEGTGVYARGIAQIGSNHIGVGMFSF